jgi:hypothetical protein
MLKKTRSYQKVVERLKKISLNSPFINLIQLGTIAIPPDLLYPFYQVQTKNPEKGKIPTQTRICLTAGTHGNEPSGVEAVLLFLEQYLKEKLGETGYHLTIFPCLNPYGYEHNTRENMENVDLNRQFRKRKAPLEVTLFRQAVGPRPFDISIEFHEDIDTHGFYLYEINPNGEKGWGKYIIQAIEKHFPINHHSKIDGLKSRKGIITRQDIEPQFETLIQERKDWPQAFFHYTRGTPRCITSETPVHLPLKDRARIHLIAMDVILERIQKTVKTKRTAGKEG